MTSATNVQAATATADCRVPGCTQEARNTRGPFAYLCDEHRREKERTGVSERRVNGAPARAERVVLTGGGFEAKAKALSKLAREADRARAKATKAAENAMRLAADADAAERQFRARSRELIGR